MQVLPALHEHGNHVVQFYEESDYLCQVVADFLVAGLSNGDPAIVIATEEHRVAIVSQMQSRGVDIEHARVQGRLTLLDARTTLESLMGNGAPDAALFESVIGEVVSPAGTGGKRACLYGEMVDLLWRDGLQDGAIQLESMWNGLAERHSFRLLCAYAMDNFASASDAERFMEICRQHDHALPTERYSLRNGATQLLHISELQQRAKALESELEYRTKLEAQLLDALQERDELLHRERAARADAEAANRAKSDFLAVMSHELRTPLNAIAGYAELLEMGIAGPVPERQREMVSRIQHSQQHLLGLIDEVLTFTRSESAPRRPLENVNLAEALRAAELSLLPQMRSRSLTYMPVTCDANLVVCGDAGRIRQIIVNLLSNATKYTPRGGTVGMKCEVANGRVAVHVHDDGVGIAPHHLETIFEQFFQVDTRLTRTDEGLGLGLAIARRFARAMNGDLLVTSTIGEGSTFTLLLPLAG
ncbi:MAG TPA: ATP-binding protein [Longimicrobiales bacterium]|nr:ATP-binding protein [Longimicrobiales bacterium]